VPLVFAGDDLVAVVGVCACAHMQEAPDHAILTAAEVPLTALAPTAPQVRWSGHPWESLGYFR